MKDFVSMDIISTLEKCDLFNILSQDFDEFKWTMGESDAQGGYVSGRNAQGVNIKLWTDENPMQLSVSFRAADLDLKISEEIIKKISEDTMPRIGQIFKVYIT